MANTLSMKQIQKMLRDQTPQEIRRNYADRLSDEGRAMLDDMDRLDQDLQQLHVDQPPVPDFRLPQDFTPPKAQSKIINFDGRRRRMSFWQTGIGLAAAIFVGAFVLPHFSKSPDANSADSQVLRSYSPDRNNTSPISSLQSAVIKADVSQIKELIANGGNVNEQAVNGQSLLHLAAREDLPEIVQVLIQSGANLNATDQNAKTPLMIAAESGNRETLSVLIQAGADLNQVSKQGETALDLAKRFRYAECERLLIQAIQ